MATSEGLEALSGLRGALERSSTAERVADALRERIIDGALAPGARLSEEALGQALGVSRNTLREAFRLLGHERLLVHRFNRGVFVAEPELADVVDLYRVRRALELDAVRRADRSPKGAVARVGAAVEEGEAAAGRGDWWGVGTANMRFHQALAALADSPRTDEVVRRLLAELRLVFHAMAAPRDFHVPYVALNRRIHRLLEEGRLEEAAEELSDYFDVAERQLVEAFSEEPEGVGEPDPR
ncbi:GntR family transcriptional regulator [Nocardiopsis suaedae]|uniref:GntR family transcriptional regulator n=1 Tax=Nocardiopsis suaedae TaxID=3018444 RepID=A0ABT4TJW3_9ACTN|nr:GntR family transcriptional regulator [Nocardiopsis suaedae]MDA2804959.1 GntR family transcriptional regulator [Nocardiopsis suaedae]